MTAYTRILHLARALVYSCVLWSAATVQAQPAAVMPMPVQQYFDDSGDPLASGTLTFYAAGTTTPQAIYSDSTLSTPLTNPLTLDADGRTATNVYLSATSYKILLKNSAGTTLWTADNIASPGYVAQQAVLPVVQTTTSTGTLNDFDLSCTTTNTFCVLRANNASDATITGFEPMTTGTRLMVVSVGAGNVFLSHQSGSSTAADRLINFITGTTTPLAAGTGVAEYVYDGTTARWRLVKHNQGAAITYTSTVTAGSGTFTTVAGTGRSFISGRTVTLQLSIAITTNGTAATYINATLPYTAAAAAYSLPCIEVASTGITCSGQISASGTAMAVRRYDGTYLGANGYTLVVSGTYELP